MRLRVSDSRETTLSAAPSGASGSVRVRGEMKPESGPIYIRYVRLTN